MLAMNVARNIMFPETKLYGYQSEELRNLVCFTSVMSHYSIAKSSSVLGLGIQGVIKVPADKNGKMIPAELEKLIQKAIAEGKKPFFINATAGTTVLGAFDPLEEIGEIAKKYNIWFHVDASWGGSLLVSEKHRHKLKGIDKANTITWNPHKALRMPHQTTFLMVRSKTALRESNNLDAQYLFKEDPYGEADYDVGTKTLMCGRNPDILKFWLTWMYHGREGLEHRINKAIDNTQLFMELIKQRPEKFRLVHDKPEFANICFFYYTPAIRKMEEGSKEWKDALNTLAPIMYREMRKAGNMMISNSPLPDGTPFFWRLIILNEKVTKQDLEFILDEFERIGEKL
jgi:glutamate/tyrosine decarboxylase-like PLP-dependent enzyme